MKRAARLAALCEMDGEGLRDQLMCVRSHWSLDFSGSGDAQDPAARASEGGNSSGWCALDRVQVQM